MCKRKIEQEIEDLGPETSKIYFDAKRELITLQDSTHERFDIAARIVRAFWKWGWGATRLSSERSHNRGKDHQN
jgi:hypothetical protein